jgi:hypothetical protein
MLKNNIFVKSLLSKREPKQAVTLQILISFQISIPGSHFGPSTNPDSDNSTTTVNPMESSTMMSVF